MTNIVGDGAYIRCPRCGEVWFTRAQPYVTWCRICGNHDLEYYASSNPGKTFRTLEDDSDRVLKADFYDDATIRRYNKDKSDRNKIRRGLLWEAWSEKVSDWPVRKMDDAVRDRMYEVFDGCAVCGSTMQVTYAEHMLIDRPLGGRPYSYNVLPMCDKCVKVYEDMRNDHQMGRKSRFSTRANPFAFIGAHESHVADRENMFWKAYGYLNAMFEVGDAVTLKEGDGVKIRCLR